MYITIYCGANLGNKKIYAEKTKKLGKWIGQNGHKLVYGGGKLGLMGLIADTVLENGGEVIGVIPEFLLDKEVAHPNLTELVIVNYMSERKRYMIHEGDAIIALPGGPGTLEEITEAISWARVGENDNPCILFNVDGYYDSLKIFFDDMVVNGFLTTSDREKFLFSDNLEEIANFISKYKPPRKKKQR